MSLHGYLQVVRERWRLVLGGLLLGVTVAAVGAMAVTPAYAATVTLFVSADDARGDAVQAYQANLLLQQKVKSYARLVTSDRIRHDLERRGLTTLGAITADVQPGTVLITVTATEPSPERAQRIADAAAESFAGLIAELEKPVAVTAKVVEPAPWPTTPVSPRPLSLIVLGVLAGLAAGTGAAFVRDTLDTTVRSAEALRAMVDAPYLGSVAFDPGVPDHPLVIHEPATSPRSESLRRVRTNLRFADHDRPASTVVVTSAMPGEGKSTMTCDLAITLAEAGRSVVVVDADLRRPRIGHYLGLESAAGLTTVLAGQVRLDQALRPWGREGMSVLASGPVPPNPSELLSSQHVADVLDLLAARFEVVLIDAPSLLPVADAAILASRCDGAVLVVRHGRTTRTQVRSAVDALDAVSARLLGTVMTMTPRSRVGQNEINQYLESAPR